MIYKMAHVQLLLLYFFVSTVKAFYLPGVAPTTYRENDNIPLLVNHLTPSMNYQHKDEDGNNVSGDKENFLYSYDYYYNRFHFCQPEKVEKQPESLGSVIFGDRIYNSPFQLNMLQEKECESLCKTVIPGDDAKFINKLIKNGFFQNWLIDGLPAAREVYDGRTKTSFYGAGFNLGFVQVTQGTDIEATPKGAETTDKDVELETRNDRNMVKTYELPYFANHFDIMIEYHDRGEGNYRVVGVIVEPVSIKRSSPGTCETTGSPLMLDEGNDNEVYFTYSVKFNESATSWATRWDKYLHVYDPSIQWFSLINFSLVVVLLSSVVIHSLLRALKSDFARYNELNLDDDFQEDSGWKLNHGDVFRSPSQSLTLSILVGSGVQLFLMVTCSIFFAALGFLSPSSRGSLATVMFILYALFGFVGSYTSMGIYKFFNGPYWKANLILTPLLVPGAILLIIIALNFFLMFVHSSGVIPASTLFFMVFLWFLFSIPLSFAGSLIARKRCHWDEHPTKTNQIARQIPFQPWYLKTIPATLIAGIFPFGSIAVELYFIYTSLWFNKIFYMFGFLFFSFLLLTLTSSLVTILITYHSLCLENWKWQWRGFIIGGAGCALYVFIHSILFTKFKLGGFTTIVLYVGYSSVISLLCCLVTGSIGFISSMLFVRKIYSSIKVD
ncbi:Emp70p [Saccharomyces cerevisiae S288C]|uniref:Transmembrane 9 superfamily member 1 n=2 Tax=Saccharomyces cerevisiae TaxID=4932 RepID=TMN1_YEAST|nr:Emp70p [Saccharomyces cerevisiae S288C]P32802.2 RecName: Full=Transmembrane 9 superfamily member 1; AltName: Full=70 kDa endomembrane protein; AltName: Full=Endomembrane protein EMP70; Contains: RecName: Full=Protein p24a; AltName: Full=Acidic 24 kDa late endocytic intermediate component; Flags: Precursor [Saccharomyces cerevisiae S288C]AAB67587.1 Emp70p: P24A protein [Saccharomyces cerevisiae]AJV46166.1 Emp70p [Saccharomyces cerevisiae YJM1083]AJV52001.1 Emp70p [Saccharomyces cerevisiae YJM|eukprot:NP_013184.1 Emp70p [Saccharomyces cerevisiae S288C]